MKGRRTVQFNSLAPETREALVTRLAASGQADGPIAFSPSHPLRSTLLCLAISLLGGAFVWRLLTGGFGDVSSPDVNLESVELVSLAILVLMFPLVALVQIGRLRSALPYRPGVYIFPLEVLDARSAELGWHSLSRIQDAEITSSSLLFKEAVVTLPLRTEFEKIRVPLYMWSAQVHEILERLSAARSRAVAAAARGEVVEIRAMELFIRPQAEEKASDGKAEP